MSYVLLTCESAGRRFHLEEGPSRVGALSVILCNLREPALFEALERRGVMGNMNSMCLRRLEPHKLRGSERRKLSG